MHVDIVAITETKIDNTFTTNQFLIEGFLPPYRSDRNKYGGGILVYIRENIHTQLIDIHTEIECISFLINLRNRKWLICAIYNPHKRLI